MNISIVIYESDSTIQSATDDINAVIQCAYKACLKFVGKNYKGPKSAKDKQKSDRSKEKSVKIFPLVKLLESMFPEKLEKVGRITGYLKGSKDFKIEDLVKMLTLTEGTDGLEFVKGKIKEAEEALETKNEKNSNADTAQETSGTSFNVGEKLEKLQLENFDLKTVLSDLKNNIENLEMRVISLEV